MRSSLRSTRCVARRATLLLGAVAFAGWSATAAGAQQAQPPAERGREAQVCNMMQKLVTIRIVDRTTGEPVSGAAITATRVRTKAALPNVGSPGPMGDYYLVEDGLPGLTRAGEPLRVTIRYKGRRVVRTYTLGLDTAGCHVDVRGGSLTVRI